jgi:hypothetical protein
LRFIFVDPSDDHPPAWFWKIKLLVEQVLTEATFFWKKSATYFFEIQLQRRSGTAESLYPLA